MSGLRVSAQPPSLKASPMPHPTFIFCALLGLATQVMYTTAAAQPLPHVNDCNYCLDCRVGAAAVAAHLPDEWGPLRPALDEAAVKATLANCTSCWGCDAKLEILNNLTAFNRTYSFRPTPSNAWSFVARHAGGTKAVIKQTCIPLNKWKPSQPARSCFSVEDGERAAAINMMKTIQMLRQECGMMDVVAKSWLGPVSAVVPEVGYHVRWHGVWTEYVEGIDIWSLVYEGKPTPLEPSKLLDLLHNNKLNGTQVVLAAVFDLLTSQCGRHPRNVLITETGQVKLVDNQAALQSRDAVCGFNSVLLPTTPRNFKWVTSPVMPHKVNPLSLLDYRCHLRVNQTQLGTDYPPQLRQCLIRLSSMTVDQIQQRHNITRLSAWNLQVRSTDMLTKGFEWTLQNGEPQNSRKLRYKTPEQACCRLAWAAGQYRCAQYRP